MSQRIQKHSGFTLVEILIALLIFSILAVIVTVGLHSALTTYQKVKVKGARFSELQVALAVMARDVGQAVPRSIITHNNQTVAALHGESTGFGITRGGYVNPGAVERRSTLQRVSYRYEHDSLVRLTWPVLDQVKQTRPSPRILLTGVDQLQVKYVDENNARRQYWPIIAGELTSLPRAVEITMHVEGLGTISRLFVVPGGVSLAQR